MKDEAQILSAFPESAPAGLGAGAPAPARRPLVFDACQVGVVLRAVLFVEAVVAVGAMFESSGLLQWLARLSVFTGGALPATLAWLVVCCSLKRLLARLPVAGQYGAGCALGALCAVYGCGLLVLVGFLGGDAGNVPWLACACGGVFMAALLVAGLELRARGRTPAATAARLAELQSRIRPHFLFNTLNSAIALVRAEPAKAEALLEDLSDLFRHALAEPRDAVPLGEEIALARHYLAIEQVRFGHRLRVRWALDPAADAARVPPLLLQPLVENAVKHGVEPSAEGAEVEVSTRRAGGLVRITVGNTVPGARAALAEAQQPGHGIALANVRDRLRLLHDVQGHFRAGLRAGRYEVRIEVPV